MDGTRLRFETMEHGGEYPDTMPQAIRRAAARAAASRGTGPLRLRSLRADADRAPPRQPYFGFDEPSLATSVDSGKGSSILIQNWGGIGSL
jgi:hypothetical protein